MTTAANFRGPIALDGPAASGKSTVGQALARQLGFAFLDTGLMYRALTLAALRRGIPATDEEGCAELARTVDMRVVTGVETRIFLGGEDVTDELRSPAVEANVSPYSAIAGVREALVARQREIASGGKVILAGRDIGTVVLPGAPIKLYLTASEDERARRRGLQAGGWGQDQAASTARSDITRRDTQDSGRAVSPLRPAEDAIQVDTTSMTLDQVVAFAIEQVKARGASRRAPPESPPSAKAARSRGRLHQVRRWFTWARFVPPFYWGGTRLLRFLLLVVTRWKVSGRENVPREGALIVVSNHLSNADPAVISAGVLGRRIRFMAKIELFRGFMGVLCRLWDAFPVRRFDADIAAMLNAERILKRGGVLGMFPEGTRSRTGRLGEPHPGTALIALRSGATILPCAVMGTDSLKSPRKLIARPRVQVFIGEPISVGAIRRPSEAQVSELTNQIFAAIKGLLPPDYLAAYTETEGAPPLPHGPDSSGE